MKKYPSFCCQNCGELIGWLGRVLPFHKCKQDFAAGYIRTEMNERITLLAEQCGYRSNPNIYDRNQSFDIPKFAELIVRECLNQCYNRGMNDELYAGQLKAAAYIEEHFGVEE